MAFISATELQPLFEHVGESIRPAQPVALCPIASAMYWAVRVDGEVGNGGLAQLIWNLHDQYDPAVPVQALRDIGADAAALLVDEAFRYIDGTPVRKQRFFAKGPFGPAKPLVRLTDQYQDLVPNVWTLVTGFIDQNWAAPTFQATLQDAGMTDIRRTQTTAEDIDVAIDSGDGAALLLMIKAGLNPDVRDDRGKTLLMRLVGRTDKAFARVETMKALVAAGADLAAVDDAHETALSIATSYGGEPAFVTCLLDLGADVNHVDNRGRTPVFGATKRPDSLIIMLDAGASLTSRASNGLSPLGCALAEYGWWLDQTDNPNRSESLVPLEQSVEILLTRGAQLSEVAIEALQPEQRHTELSAIVQDHVLLMRLLLLPSISQTPDVVGGGAWTALHEASRVAAHDSIQALCDDGRILVDPAMSTSDLSQGAFAGATPLDVAADATVADLLRGYGATPGQRSSHDVFLTSQGDTPHDVITFVAELADFDLESATSLVGSLPPTAGEVIGRDGEGNLILYSAQRVAKCSTADEARDLVRTASERGATAVVI